MIQEVEVKSVSKPEDLSFFKKKVEGLHWYIFYTYPKTEKIVYKDLLRRGFDVYLPVNKSLNTWKNRQKKWIETPLFPNYIFVRAFPHQLNTILKCPKVVSYISFCNKPSIIPEEEIEAIRATLKLDMELSIERKFYEGEKVRIIEGPMAGKEGILIKQNGKIRFGILLNEIKHTIVIDICGYFLEKVDL